MEDKLKFVLEGLGIHEVSVKVKILLELLRQAGSVDFSKLKNNVKSVAKTLEMTEASVKNFVGEFETAYKTSPRTIKGSQASSDKLSQQQIMGTLAYTARVIPEIDKKDLEKEAKATFSTLKPVEIPTSINLSADIKRQYLDIEKTLSKISDPALQVKTLQNVLPLLRQESELNYNNVASIKDKRDIAREYNRILENSFNRLSVYQEKSDIYTKVPKEEIERVQESIKSGKEYVTTMESATKKEKENIETKNQAIKTNEKFNNSLNTAIGKLIRYRVAFFVMRGVVDSVKQSIQEYIDVQFKIAQLSVVLNTHEKEVAKLRDTAFELGESYGGNILEIVDAMKIWGQTGLKTNEIISATQATLIGMNALSASAKEVTEALTAAIFTYGIEAENVTEIISKWLAVERKFPISATDLANSLKIVGAAAKVVGVDLDDLSGYVAAVGSITRKSGAAVGQSLKTMFARLPRKEVIKVFENVGVAVLSTATELRDLDKVLDELSTKWKEISSVQKANLAVTFGGIRRYADFIALMDNYEVKMAATIISQRASKEAFQANEKIMATFKKQWEATKVAISELGVSIGKVLVGPLSKASNILKSLAKTLSNTENGMATFIAKIIASVSAFSIAYITLSGVVFIVTKLAREIKILTAGLSALRTVTAGMNIALAALSIVAGIIAWNLTSSAMAANNASSAFQGVTDALDRVRASQDKIKELNTEIQLLGKAPSRIEDLVNNIRKVGLTSSEAKDDVESFNLISKSLIQVNSDLGGVVNELSANLDNEAYSTNKVTNAIEEQLTTKKKLLKVVQEANTINIKEAEKVTRYEIKKNEALNKGLEKYKKYLSNIEKIEERPANIQPLVKFGVETTDDISKQLNTALYNFKNSISGEVYNTIEKKFKGLKGEELSDAISQFYLEIQNDIARGNKTLNEILGISDIDTKFFIGRKLSEELVEDSKTFRSASSDFFNSILKFRDKFDKNIISEKEFLKIFPKDSIKGYFESQFDEISLSLRTMDFGEIASFNTFKFDSAEKYVEAINKLALDTQSQIRDAEMNVQYLAEAQRVLLELDNKRKDQGPTKPFIELSEEEKNRFKQDAEKLLSFMPAYIRNELLESEDIFNTLGEQLTKYTNTVKELPDLYKSLMSGELYIQSIKLMKERRKLEEASYFNQKEINGLFTTQIDLLKNQESIMSLFPEKLSEQEKIQKNIAQLQYEQDLLIANQIINSQEKLNAKVKATEDYLSNISKIINEISQTKLNKIFTEVAENSQIIQDSLSGAFDDIPDTILEGIQNRKDLTEDLREAEFDLQEARREGDADSIADAKYRLELVQYELDQYKKGWYEIRTIILEVLENISSKVWTKLTDQIAEDLSNITIGSQSIGELVGNAVTRATDNFVNNWKIVVTDINKQHEIALRTIFSEHISALKVLYGSNYESQFMDYNTLNSDLAKGLVSGFGTQQTDKNDEKINKLTRALSQTAILLGSVASNALSASFFGSGQGQSAGSQIGSVLGVSAGEEFLSFLGGLSGPTGSILGGLVGGLFGSIFDSGDNSPIKPLRTALQENTEATLQNTIELKQLDSTLFNAPTRYNIPSFSGGYNGNISIQINSNNNPEDIAKEVINRINKEIEESSNSYSSRGFSPY